MILLSFAFGEYLASTYIHSDLMQSSLATYSDCIFSISLFYGYRYIYPTDE